MTNLWDRYKGANCPLLSSSMYVEIFQNNFKRSVLEAQLHY